MGRLIEALRRARSWNQVDLAQAAGLSRYKILKMESGDGEFMTVGDLWKIAAALNIQRSDLCDRRMYLAMKLDSKSEKPDTKSVT